VHAAVLSEKPFEMSVLIFIFLETDQGPRVPLQIRLILVGAELPGFQAGQFIPLLAGHLAAPAGGTQGGVDQFYEFRSFHRRLPPTTFPR
jgi:hypothetical protein